MLDEGYIVEKSKPLVWAQFRDYGVGELKILETYLSRINARDPDSSVVIFTKKEYAELMGIDPDVRTDQLKGYTRGLLSNVVTIDLPEEGYVQYPLFSEAKCHKKQGQVVVEIECNEKLKSAFFGIAQSGYIRYQLKNTIALRSIYSIRLYSRLKDRPHGWTVELDELRDVMGATASSYDVFKEFNRAVLQKAVAEINEITDIEVEAEKIRRGKAVVAIKFLVKSKKTALPAPESGAEDPFAEVPEEGVFDFQYDDGVDINDPIVLILSDLPSGFTREQAESIRAEAIKHVPYEVASFTEKDIWISDYVQSKVLMMKAQKNPVHKNAQYSWLLKAVTQDWH